MAAFSARRRRLLAVPLIVAFHAAMLAGLALVHPPPTPDSLIFLDLSPRPGEGPPSPIKTAPKPPGKEAVEATKPSSASPDAARAETKSTTPQQVEKAAGLAPAKSVETLDTTPDTTNDPAVTTTDPSSSPADVLAMVERITGADASTIAQPVTTPVSQDRLAEIRLQQLRAFATRPGGGCAIDIALKVGLSDDPLVQTALASIPAADKSVSNALQLWDGQWTSTPPAGQADTLAVVRERTIAVVAAAPANCRDAAVRGPRFIIVPVAGQADMVIVIGSGDWRWRDVLPARPPGLFRWFGIGR